ncbi:MAG: TerC family protein [Planctomycetota bacterium]|nr:TerC family protein [Planctomycetota bacterium]RLS26017.1 MAG: TerC family protein [Planctomycetota bacterium]
MLELLSQPETYISLATLTLLEVVLGIDNILLISILSSRLPQDQREKARKLGLIGALFTRLSLLSMVSYLAKLTQPLVEIGSWHITGKSLLLLFGGLFLIWKATKEIHEKIDLKQEHEHQPKLGHKLTLSKVVWQIMILDVIFSLDSVVTAVGMARAIPVMVAANILALGVMLLASKPIADFVENYPSVKVLALAFLMTVGIVLVGESFEIAIPKGYVYFGMGFSLFVEMLNIRVDQVARRREGMARTEQVDQTSAV